MIMRKRLSITICLVVTAIMCLLGVVSTFSFNRFIAKADTTGKFVGVSGSPNDNSLYSVTNTYNYLGNNNEGEDEDKSIYDYFDTGVGKKNTNSVYSGAPQITVLTHGLGGGAFHWSNNGLNVFAYDEDSLFMRIDEELSKNGGNGAHLYWAKMININSFYLYDLKTKPNDKNVYLDNVNTVTSINDISKHIVIVFEATYSARNGYNYQVYEEFNYMLSKIVYDVKCLNGGYLPKINLIGHSRGGLTNLQYALDHPHMVASMFSIGTPFFGSDTAATSLGAKIAIGTGRLDIINREVFTHYYERWNNDYDRLYSGINTHALGGYSDSDFVLDAIIASDDPDIERIVNDETLGNIKWGIKSLPGVLKIANTLTEVTDFVLSFFRDKTYTQSEWESIVQIIADIQYFAFDDNDSFWENLWSNIIHNFRFVGCPYFMNDLLVDLSSQLGYDGHGNSNGDYGFKTFSKCFKERDYSDGNSKKISMSEMPAVVHNLEARDNDFINYILSNITLGVNESRFLYDRTSSTTATVYGYKGEILTDTISIPEQIDGLTIDAVAGNIFANKGNIVSIILPNTLKTIGAYAFAGLQNLTTITFAGTGQPQLEKIGYGAFSGCTNLKKFNSSAAETLNRSDLNMPDSVEFIDCYAFYGTGFTEIFLGTNIYYIGDVAFSNIAGLTNISVTGNSTYFSSNGALYNSDGWLMQYPVGKDDTSFTIPSSVSNVAIRHISQFAFMGENNLDTINLGNVITIDSYAFTGCTKLSGFDNASNIEYVGPFALDDTRIMLETQDFITLGEVLYKYKGTASVLEASDFPSGVTRIASNAFCCNDNIEKIYLPNKIIDIDNNAFVDCANLEEIIYYNGILPDVGKYSFLALPDTFKFKCRKSLIDSVTSSNNWYSQRDVMSAISTEVYFEDINKTATFYWGKTVELPTETISGKYIKGWLRVDESTGQTCGDYLSSSSVWNETVSHATYRADTETLESYTLQFFNGDVQIGSFNISTGDEFSITQTGYVLNGTSHTFANYEAMVNCAYKGYYGASVVNGQVIAIFKGWLLNDELISDGRWINSYSDNALRVEAKWEPIEFTATVYNGYSSTYTKQFNYCEGLILDNPVRSGYMFKGWRNNGTGVIVDMPLIIAGNISLTAQWVKIYTITYANLTFMGRTARVYWNNYSSYAPTYYERGVGLDLTNVNALWTGYNTHSLCLVFLGWYTDMNFNTKVTSISTSATGNRTYYAKWRYDYEATGFWAESGTLITDAGQFNNPYNSILLGLSTTDGFYENLLSIGIKYLVLNYEIKMHEIDDGYQRIYVYDGSGKDATQLYYNQFEYYSPGKKTSSGIVQRRIVIPISSLQNINYLYIRYDGSGWGKDDWVIERMYCEVMYINSIEDINGPEFNWRNDYPFSDDSIEIGWDD